MKISPLLILALVAAIALVVSNEQPVAASQVSEYAIADAAPRIHRLERAVLTAASAPQRDLFFAAPPVAPPAPVEALSAPVPQQAGLPAFRILGKQQDETGWSVFITQPGKNALVWVVREGESFDERFRVSKLAPPVLVIKSINGRQSRTFNIGNDEE